MLVFTIEKKTNIYYKIKYNNIITTSITNNKSSCNFYLEKEGSFCFCNHFELYKQLSLFIN